MEEKVKAFLELATQKKASDIFIIAGRPLSVKMNLSGSFTSLLTTGI